MQPYEKYSISELAIDDFFLESCLNPTIETKKFWQEWIESNPEKNETWLEAKKIIKSLSEGRKKYALVCMPEEKVDFLWNKIHTTITLNNNSKIIKEKKWKLVFKWAIAALVLIILSISTFFISQKPQKPFQANNVESFTKLAIESLHEEVNDTDSARKIKLSDGSFVTLFPKSSIQYSEKFIASKREIYLKGKALFDVAHDSTRPFFVFTNDVVTKVLGTKFLISSNTNRTTVSVQSGKVSVVKRKEMNNSLPNVMVLLPNQQVDYVAEDEIISKGIIATPVIINKTSSTYTFKFDDTPISKVFDELEKAYGINIVYLDNNFSNCTLTASLVHQPFFTKIDLICETLNAHYEVLDGQVFITGAGCE